MIDNLDYKKVAKELYNDIHEQEVKNTLIIQKYGENILGLQTITIFSVINGVFK